MQPITPDLLHLVRAGKLGGQLLDDGALRYVVFLTPVRMAPIIRNAEEAITTTVARQEASYDVVVNGNYYDVSYWTGIKAAAGLAQPPANTTILGEVVEHGRVVAGDSHPDRFYLAEVKNLMQRSPNKPDPHKHAHKKKPPPPPPFLFQVGQGDPPQGAGTEAAMGNLGPMLVHGLHYGVGNRYRAPATGPVEGDPGPKLRDQLTQRNNKTFSKAEERDDRTGKTLVAWHAKENALLVGVEKDHDQGRPGETYTRLTQRLGAAGFTDAVFFDGSDSAMLWYKGQLVIAPGERKDNEMRVALGFAALPAPTPPPKPKVHHR